MRKTDIIPRESVTHSIERFHHGPLGRVLERHLKRCHLQAGSSYSMVALKKLWSLAASNDPAIGLHLFSHFSRQDWSVLLHAALYSADLAGAVRFWASYAQLASDMDEVVLVEIDEVVVVVDDSGGVGFGVADAGRGLEDFHGCCSL